MWQPAKQHKQLASLNRARWIGQQATGVAKKEGGVSMGVVSAMEGKKLTERGWTLNWGACAGEVEAGRD